MVGIRCDRGLCCRPLWCVTLFRPSRKHVSLHRYHSFWDGYVLVLKIKLPPLNSRLSTTETVANLCVFLLYVPQFLISPKIHQKEVLSFA